MLLSTSMGGILGRFSCEESIELLAQAGFDAIDFPFFGEEYYNEETDREAFREHFRKLKELAGERGLCFNQAHAPTPSSRRDAAKTEKIFRDIVRSMRNASYLGIDTIVVHPMQHLFYYAEGVPEQLFEMNMDFYRRLIPYCEEYGIRVAVENMWQEPGGRKISHSTCSRPEEFIRYVDELNSPWMVACLDIGHAFLVCEDPADFIRKLGPKRLQALHVHDVDGIEDLHTLPYYGVIDWSKTAKALKEIGYTGNFTYEAGAFVERLPKELYLSGLRHMVETGRYLMSLVR